MKRLTDNPTMEKNNAVPFNRDQDRTVLALIVRTFFICLFGYGVVYVMIQLVKAILN